MGWTTGDANSLEGSLSALASGGWYGFTTGSIQVPGKVELVRPGADLTQLAARARAYPGRAWIVGNEPNVSGQDNLQPAAYSDFLAAVATAIKTADPTALLVGPNVLNWDKTCDGCGGYPSGHSWSNAFLSDYRARYGSLPLDVWGMHTYNLDWVRPPLINAVADQAQLAAARTWLNATGLNLPIWLTEFGVIWGYEGYTWVQQDGRWLIAPTGRFRDDLMNSYMDSMFTWLTGPGVAARVERWFLYGTSPAAEPYATTMAGISLIEPGRLVLTSFGERFRAWATRE